MSGKKSLQKEHTAMETGSTREKSLVILRLTLRNLGKAVLIIPVITALVLGACQSPDSAPAPAVISETADLPTSTESVIEASTLTPTSTPIPEVEFEKVTNPAEMDKMSTITLEDLKPGSAFSKWRQEQLDKMGPIASNPSDIDYVYWYVKSLDSYSLAILKKDTTNIKSVRATELFSLFKIDLGPWGFPGKTGLVASYVYEDKDGNQAMVELFFPVSATTLPQHESLFKDPRGRRLAPKDKISGAVLDKMFFDQTPGGDGDLREVARKFYEAQGYTREQIQGLFQRIANSDLLTDEDKEMLESIIFLGVDVIVSE